MAQAQFYLLGYPISLVFCIFYHTKMQIDSFSMMLDAHCYVQTLPGINNPPTWMVYPLHTCEACPKKLDSLFQSIQLYVDAKKH